MITANLFIGANNETGDVEIDVVHNILAKRFPEGYTVLSGAGYWQGGSEPMVLAIVTGLPEYVTEVAAELRDELEQQAVGVQFLPAIQFI